MSLVLNACDADGANPALLATIATLGPASYAKGDVVAHFVIPSDAGNYCTGAIIATANQSTAGKLAMFSTYLPR